MDQWVDDDGYPTDAAIDCIEDDGQWASAEPLLEFAASLWHWPDFVTRELSPEEVIVTGVEVSDRVWRFATGGWSGNEAVINALRRSIMGRMAWQLSARGGLHIFAVTTPQT